MRALLQRVSQASVSVDGQVVGQIGAGWLILLGVGPGDTPETAASLADNVATLRCFPDDAGKTNRSLLDVGGQALVVSQFTLYADVRRGRRPSFGDAAPPDVASNLVNRFVEALGAKGVHVERGVFGAMMQVSLVNEGPFTIWLDTDTR